MIDGDGGQARREAAGKIRATRKAGRSWFVPTRCSARPTRRAMRSTRGVAALGPDSAGRQGARGTWPPRSADGDGEPMTRKQKRLAVIGGGMAFLACAAGADLLSRSARRRPISTCRPISPRRRRARRSASASAGWSRRAVVRGEGTRRRFAVTDKAASPSRSTITASCPTCSARSRASSPKAASAPDGVFVADSVLAKHDENYMPKEVADSLKAQGRLAGRGSKPVIVETRPFRAGAGLRAVAGAGDACR